MPTYTVPYDMAPALTTVSSKWRDSYVTQGLNLKFSGVNPEGVYSGWKVEAGSGNQAVKLTSDSVTGTSVLVSKQSSGEALTVAFTGTIDNIALTSYSNSSVVLAIQTNYTAGSATTATIVAIPVATYDGYSAGVKREYVALGTVAVPAGGNPITVGMISADRRSYAWDHVGSDAVLWTQLVRDSSFESMREGSDPSTNRSLYWDFGGVTGGGNWIISGRTLAFGPFTGTHTYTLSQRINVPVVPSQRFVLRVTYEVQAISSGTNVIRPFYVKAKDIAGSETNIASIPIDFGTSTSGNKVTKEVSFVIGASPVRLTQLYLDVSSDNTLFHGGATAFTSVQLFLDTSAQHGIPNVDGSSLLVSDKLRLANQYSPMGAPFGTEVTSSNGTVTMAEFPAGTGVTSLALGGSVSLGTSRLDTDDNAAIPRITAPYLQDGVTPYTLIGESVPSDGVLTANSAIRLYAASSASTFLVGQLTTINAVWVPSTSKWHQPVTGKKSQAWFIGPQDNKMLYKSSGTVVDWADNAWTLATYAVPGGSTTFGDLVAMNSGLTVTGDTNLAKTTISTTLGVTGATSLAATTVSTTLGVTGVTTSGSLRLTSATPVPPVADTLYAASIPKAWGWVNCSAGATPTLTYGGFNLDTATWVSVGSNYDVIHVLLKTPIPTTTNLAVQLTYENSGSGVALKNGILNYIISSGTPTYVDIARTKSDGTLLSKFNNDGGTGGAVQFSFVVFGA